MSNSSLLPPLPPFYYYLTNSLSLLLSSLLPSNFLPSYFTIPTNSPFTTSLIHYYCAVLFVVVLQLLRRPPYFSVAGRRFYAHRIYLLASSDAFRAMFDGGYREKDVKDIEIPNIQWNVFEFMMRYIYTGSVNASLDIAQDLLRATDQYLLEGLKRLCECTIAQDVSVENVTLMYELSEAFNVMSFRHSCILFILEQFDISSRPWTREFREEEKKEEGKRKVKVMRERAGARDDKGDPVIKDMYSSHLTASGNTHDNMLLAKGECVYTGDLGSSMGLPILPEWLFFNRVNTRARTGMEVGLTNFLLSLSGGNVVGNFSPHEAFVIGGTNSVRGYEEGAVGSGRSDVVGCGEISFPLFGPVDGALFADYGTDLGLGTSVPGDPAGARLKPGSGYGYGFGIRVESPLGPL
ncbi:hypothetical protein KSS87_022311 [Heliosperma pusillum]|nr:hypothetical protein KSS87_022311 [Heliosperma pusillum]